MKLYQLTEQYRADVARLQDLDLPPEVVMDTIDAMQGDVTEKIKAVVVVALEMEAEAKARAEHAARMAASAKALEARAEGLRSYAQIAIQNCGLTLPLKYPEFNIDLARNPPSCEVTDVEKVPMAFRALEIGIKVEAGALAQMSHEEVEAVLGELSKDFHDNLCFARLDYLYKPDKKALLAHLKEQDKANQQRADGTPPAITPGARMNPTSYRVVVK